MTDETCLREAQNRRTEPNCEIRTILFVIIQTTVPPAKVFCCHQSHLRLVGTCIVDALSAVTCSIV